MYAPGYGEVINVAHVIHLEVMTKEDQLKFIKELWQEDPQKYYEWKGECMKLGDLPELFGTPENPIPIDESKL